ncbi:relaxase/mobilization nuclease domain-containing protein [Deefgea rivuli]|uniref:relaxase/mobilization nuclease domain-containing protein n=1 Tax=Deefgea rivuli TaxID=400948 RepID=UPI000488148C|nr:relaxase/mobilization nuclease domain-containing protein [Deefgea rivuli]
MNITIIHVPKLRLKSPRDLIHYLAKNADLSLPHGICKLRFLNGVTSNIQYEIDEFCREIKRTRANSRPLLHIAISFSPCEYASKLEIEMVIMKILTKLEIHKHRVVYCPHLDTANLHLHLAISRVDPDSGKVVRINNGFTKKGFRRIMDQISADFGWTSEAKSRTALQMLEIQYDKKSAQIVKSPKFLNEILRLALGKAKCWQDFHLHLLRIGPRVSFCSQNRLLYYFNSVYFYEKELPKTFHLNNLIKKFGPYEELNYEFETRKFQPHASHFGIRKDISLSSRLQERPHFLDRRSASNRILPNPAKYHRLQNSPMRWEHDSESDRSDRSDQSETIRSDRKIAEQIYRNLKNNKDISLLYRLGSNPDLLKFDSEDLTIGKIENFLRKSRLVNRSIEFHLQFNSSKWLCFRLNDHAFAVLEKLPLLLISGRINKEVYVAINIVPILENFIGSSTLAAIALLEIILEAISVDRFARQEVGFLIYSKNRKQLTSKKHGSKEISCDFLQKISSKIKENISNNKGLDRHDIKSFLLNARRHFISPKVHFTRELYLFFFIGVKKFGDLLCRKSLTDAFADIAENHGYSRDEVQDMVLNFDCCIANRPKITNSSGKVKPKYEDKPELAEKYAVSMLSCDLACLMEQHHYWIPHLIGARTATDLCSIPTELAPSSLPTI